MILGIKILTESIQMLNTNIAELISKQEEIRKIQLEQKQAMDGFISALTSFFSFEKKIELQRENREEEGKLARTPTLADLRY